MSQELTHVMVQKGPGGGYGPKRELGFYEFTRDKPSSQSSKQPSKQATQPQQSSRSVKRKPLQKTNTPTTTPLATSREPQHANKFSSWAKKAGLSLASIALGGFLLYQGGRAVFSSDKLQTNEVSSSLEATFLPEGAIATATHDDKIYYFTARDPFMRNLSAQKAYVNLEDLTVDTETMNKTIALVSQLDFDALMKTTNLNGMYKLYTGFTKGTTDFEFALTSIAALKIQKMNGRFAQLLNNRVTAYDVETTPKTNLAEYKENVGQQLETMLADFDKEKFYEKHSHPEKQRFFDNYVSHLNENILLSYAITELFPDINPAFNIASFDKFLNEAGEYFVNNIYAVHDEYLSGSEFQLTSKIIKPGGAPSLNQYFAEESRIPASMKYFDTPEEFQRGAIMCILYNAEILANKLFTANELTNFNNNFEQLSPKEQELFIAGQTSAAHHYSTLAASAVRNYQQQVTHNQKNFEDILTSIDYGKGLDKYYDQSVRNYLVLDALKNQEKKK